ncbi:hypothetical protein [Bacillus toyonensis]|uniref:hypothetical protein n=1 Tax=Bacillus toyonensis TaxID=155322 RepID=UPI002E222014|nr:hypothetical protein [Bacillus toyonensis]
MTKTIKFITNGYTYENLLTDACYYAIGGTGSLKMGVHDLIEGFQLSFCSEESFDEVLKYYNKSYANFISDVVKTFKRKMRAIRKEKKLNASINETESKVFQVDYTNNFEREIEEEITSVFGVQMLDSKTMEQEQILENELQQIFQPVCNPKNLVAVKVIPDTNNTETKQHQPKEAVAETIEPIAHTDRREDSGEKATSQEQICLEEFITSDNPPVEQTNHPKDIISLEKKKEAIATPKVTSHSDPTELTLDKLAHLISSKEIKTKDDFETIIKDKWQYKSGKDSKLLFSIVKVCKIKENDKTIGFDDKKMASLFKSLLLDPYKKQKEAC